MQIKTFIFGLFQTNTYVVSDQEGHVLIIDPACSCQAEQQMLYEAVTTRPVGIVATHGHLDHLWGAAWAAEQWGLPVLVPEADIPMAKAMQQQYDLFDLPLKAKPFPMEALTAQSEVLTTFGLQLIATPGHTPGSVCLYQEKEKVLFSGDTLFRYGYGRTDLPGGDMRQLLDSLKRLMALPKETEIYAGHGVTGRIGECF